MPSLHFTILGALAQLGERRLCKPEVTGSIPVRSTRESGQKLHDWAQYSVICQYEANPLTSLETVLIRY
jgi:hypothetical protein